MERIQRIHIWTLIVVLMSIAILSWTKNAPSGWQGEELVFDVDSDNDDRKK